MDNKGFTLTELVIVVAIIGILAAIAIPGYIGQQKRAARNEAYSNLENLRLLEEQFYAENGSYAPTAGGTLTYLGTHGTADGGLEDTLTAFKPGPEASLNFAYTLTTPAGGATFTGTATGKNGTRVEGESYNIDNNNDKNF